MASRALCVGINDYPMRGKDLRGCVNDARAWAKVLHRSFAFAEQDVTVLLDSAATKRAIVAGLDRLLRRATKGDALVFCMSSHGTYLADSSGDETDRYDEALCPYDVADHPLRDDELRERFADLTRGVRLTVVADTCHSGSTTRVGPTAQVPPPRNPTARVRFLSPDAIGRPAPRLRPRSRPAPAPLGPEVLVSGCRDDQSAHDARFGHRYYGAMSHAALDILRHAGYRLTYRQLAERLGPAVRGGGFDQDPVVSGRPEALEREVFR